MKALRNCLCRLAVIPQSRAVSPLLFVSGQRPTKSFNASNPLKRLTFPTSSKNSMAVVGPMPGTLVANFTFDSYLPFLNSRNFFSVFNNNCRNNFICSSISNKVSPNSLSLVACSSTQTRKFRLQLFFAYCAGIPIP